MPNPWASFQELLDKPATQVATINSTTGQTSVVELLSGDTLKVRGTGNLGAKVFIRDGEIIQEAGTLTQFNLVLY